MSPVLVTVHHDDDPVGAAIRSSAPPGLNHRAGHHPVGGVAVHRDLHGAQDGDVDVAAADHGETGRGVEVGRARHHRHGLLAGVDQVRVDLVLVRKPAHPKDAVLGVQGDVGALGEVVPDEGGQAEPRLT
jgi:hypothetical protein